MCEKNDVTQASEFLSFPSLKEARAGTQVRTCGINQGKLLLVVLPAGSLKKKKQLLV